MTDSSDDPTHLASESPRGRTDGGGFPPGIVLGNRFRISGLLGRGGMGEVYRADDLRLGQPVALKFLPAAVAQNAAWRSRFYEEVRITRQISHPNVCRVYDIDQTDGRYFLSMEYIDGEDLASLLKRIGRLTNAKVLEIAHQLCAGLAAAHRNGVLHRDLKPANVMIDGRGQARITDFGLAIEGDAGRDAGILLGTPQYMAPEQLAGRPASVQSDIYALGLILYELCTGAPPLRAATIHELRSEREMRAPQAPSAVVRDVDPALDRLILRCLDRDPRGRPPSVVEVAATLPGGDPLAAALAAGETPSPQMVAAASDNEVTGSPAVWALVALVTFATALAAWLGSDAILSWRIAPDRPPDALVERARRIAEHAGFAGRPADSAFGIVYNDAYLQHVAGRDQSPGRWRALGPEAVLFWYRQSEHPLRRLAFGIGLSNGVTPADPPIGAPGDLFVVMTGDGRLAQLAAVPPSGAPPLTSELDWPDLFRDAGLDLTRATPADPLADPIFWADGRRAWHFTERAGMSGPVRVDVATRGGRLTEFQAVYPWTEDRLIDTRPFSGAAFVVGAAGRGARTATLIGFGLVGVAMFGGLFVARRNLRLARGDRRGATRLVVAVAVLLAASWLLDEHHVADAHEWYLLVSFAGRALVIGGIFWWTYVAFEPYVRRHWPSQLVSWTRLLAGRVTDPRVGRDVLLGCATGAVLTSLLLAGRLLPSWLGWPAERLATPTWHAWLGPSHAVSLAMQLLCAALLDAFVALFLVVVVRMIVRPDSLAAVVAAAMLAIPDVLLSEHPGVTGGVFFAVYLIGVLLLIRVGLLTVIVLRFTVDLLQVYPMAPPSAWYSGLGIGSLVLLAVIVALATRAALGRWPSARRQAEWA